MGWRAVMGIPEVESALESPNDLGRPGCGEHVTGTERIAALDREGYAQDRAIARGYDVDESHPDHAAFVERQNAEYETAKAIARHCEAAGVDLADYLAQHGFVWLIDLEKSR